MNTKTISTLNEYQENKMTELFNRFGIFFAFSTKQFEESKKQGVEYVSLGMGMIVPKENVKPYMEQFQQLCKELENKYQEQVPLEDYISYQLSNHEAFYTYDIEPTLEAVRQMYPNCTEEEVQNVFSKECDKLNY